MSETCFFCGKTAEYFSLSNMDSEPTFCCEKHRINELWKPIEGKAAAQGMKYYIKDPYFPDKGIEIPQDMVDLIRADEREKAAQRIEALADREERESLMTWGQHFVHLGAFEACAKLVRGGEQE